MPAPVPKEPLVREGRDATIAALLLDGPPAHCPYRPHTKRALFWHHGATKAAALIDQLMKIGATHA